MTARRSNYGQAGDGTHSPRVRRSVEGSGDNDGDGDGGCKHKKINK